VFFRDIVGQQKAKQFLRQVTAREKLPHAYLFTGISGIGKTSTAKAVAMALNCRRPREGDACGQCTPCRQMMDGNSPDFLRIAPEPDSQYIKVEQIREGLQRAIGFAPMGPYRISLIHEAQKMTDEAANSFLKTLEEPPPGNVIILVTTEPRDLLPTIVSRCQRVSFLPLSPEQISAWLVENRGIDAEAAQVLSKICEGSLGFSLWMLEQDFLEVRSRWLARVIQLGRMSKEEVLDAAMEVADGYGAGISETSGSRGLGIVHLLNVWASWFRDLLLVKTRSAAGLVVNVDFSRQLKKVAENAKIKNLLDSLMLLEKAERDLRRNRNKRLVMAHTFLRLNGLK